jgi:hypothetical protein
MIPAGFDYFKSSSLLRKEGVRGRISFLFLRCVFEI